MIVQSKEEQNYINVQELINELLKFYSSIPKTKAFLIERKNIQRLLLMLRFKGPDLKGVLKFISGHMKAAQNSKLLNSAERNTKLGIWVEVYKIMSKHLKEVQ